MRRSPLIALFVASTTLGSAAPAHAAMSCGDLTKISLPATTITHADVIAPGTFMPPAPPPQAGRIEDPRRGGRGTTTTQRGYTSLPEFCRVAATLRPSADSDIKIEVWLPTSGWNGKFQGIGNGGWAGTIGYPAMAEALGAGYATAGTDTGHVGGSASFALGHPEKLVDFGYRAVHEMTVKAKAIVDAYYGGGPKLAIWNSCSTGGRQAITEAERYPADYDGIVAGAPAIYNMSHHAARVALWAAVHRTEDSYIPPEKYPMIHQGVLNACDALDGITDGIIEDPLRCHFDPKVLQCQGADGPSCLTPAQVETARIMYSPIKGLAGAPPLLQPGTELSWGTLAGPKPLPLALDALKFVVFKDPAWDIRAFNAATDLDLAARSDENVLSLTDPNLKPFFDGGGKLLMYHGWADPQVPAQNAIRYFNDVVKTTGKSAAGRSIQLYMMPGMGHCRGGVGPDTFDKVGTMERWIAQGTAPARIVASHETMGTVDRTRPLCPYGQVAKWKGSGSSDRAENFACVAAESR